MPNSAKERRIAIMGFRSVGKSSLAIQFVQGQFVDYYEPTIECTFNKTVNVRGNQYDLHLVDTAGQDEYTIFPAEYSVDVHGYVLVYSIDSPHSFEVCKNIHEKLMDLVGLSKVPIVLVGNKSDLHTDRRVTLEQGKRLAEEMKAVFIETSAKENQNVEDIFKKVIAQMESIDGVSGDGEANGKCLMM